MKNTYNIFCTVWIKLNKKSNYLVHQCSNKSNAQNKCKQYNNEPLNHAIEAKFSIENQKDNIK